MNVEGRTKNGVVIVGGLVLLLALIIMVGCQWGVGAQPAPTPMPPATPSPPQPATGGTTGSDQKLVEGYLHVEYIPPCAMMSAPAEWVAPIRLTDLRSGSVVYLNRNGTLRDSPKPDYKTEEGKGVLESALNDSELVKEIVGRPPCPDRVVAADVRQRVGWPDAHAVDIGEPPMPKVAMNTLPPSIPGPPRTAYPGWRGAYCWPISGGSQVCEETADWKGFGDAEAMGASAGTRFYVAVRGDETNPGVVRRVEVFPVRMEWSLRKLGRELHLWWKSLQIRGDERGDA